jgi:hypothetical protein
VICSTLAKFDISQLKELSLEVTGEDPVAIRDDRPGKSMQSVNGVKERLGHTSRREWMA